MVLSTGSERIASLEIFLDDLHVQRLYPSVGILERLPCSCGARDRPSCVMVRVLPPRVDRVSRRDGAQSGRSRERSYQLIGQPSRECKSKGSLTHCECACIQLVCSCQPRARPSRASMIVPPASSEKPLFRRLAKPQESMCIYNKVREADGPSYAWTRWNLP